MENNQLNLMKLLKRILILIKIYKYKTEGRSPKDFNNYQNPIDLFINLRDGNVNPRRVLS